MSNLIHMLKKELKETFRDKKSLSMMLVIPILIPLVVIGFSAMFNSEIDIPVENYNKIGFSYELSDVEKEIADELKIEVISGTENELKKEYENGNINLYVTKENNIYTLNGKNDENTSYASTLMTAYFDSYKQYLQSNYVANEGINPEDVINIILVEENIIDEENFIANYIVSYIFIFILMAITISATYPATDTTAGEKERGTLETLLTFPIKSRDIIVGKFLSVTISSIITGILSLVLANISLGIANDMFDIYDGAHLMLSFKQIVFAMLIVVAYSFLISGLCIAIASKSKTFKEAQSALTPLTFISVFPGMIASMIEVESTNMLSLIPFINYSLIFDDIASNSIDIVKVILMLVSTIIVIAIVLSIIIKQYKSEKVLFSN